ncbi:DEDDh 3'-5' exonuclease domain of the epsilon subunit of DNA polymerase III [hydrothermal vent metagenome]|uniref:DEDDh 3'-5' exonuclease domain of the epsilon subunit of DNA polymerase III n=1 Tax=hydrothermal vent metagenome TaxID=652676 RepID=A0A3B1EA42_9ZZZZ
MKYLDKLTTRLIKSPLKIKTFRSIIGNFDTFFNDIDLEIELLISNGYPIEFKNDIVYLKTATTPIEKQTFCIVDIETTSSKASVGQIIEIGAIKYRDGEIIDTYKSFVNTYAISQYIEQLTGITIDMVQDAPLLREVIEEFKIFLGDDVFVAHAISFDYKFISDTMEQFDLGKLCNRKLCTIDLAKRTIANDKYGLKYLKELLNIEIGNHHRAYDDAYSTSIILQNCFNSIPNIKTAEELIAYSKSDNLKVIKQI